MTHALKKFALLFFFLLYPSISAALEVHEKIWLGVNSQHYLSADKTWLSTLFLQLRFIDQNHPLQAGLIEFAMGHHVFTHDSVWVGYRFTGRNPYNGFNKENRIFEQFIYVKKNVLTNFVLRTRLEQITRSDENQIAVQFRQRFAIEIKKEIFNKWLPFFYDEIFFQLAKTNYTAHQFFSENRLFLGFNAYVKEKSWWEIGYMNQYQIKTPLVSENQMGHNLLITYNFI